MSRVRCARRTRVDRPRGNRPPSRRSWTRWALRPNGCDAEGRGILQLDATRCAAAERVEYVRHLDQSHIAQYDLAGHVRHDEWLAGLDGVVGEYVALDEPRLTLLEERVSRDCEKRARLRVCDDVGVLDPVLEVEELAVGRGGGVLDHEPAAERRCAHVRSALRP